MIGRNTLFIYTSISLLLTLCKSSRILIAPLDIGFTSRAMNEFKLGKILVKAQHEVRYIYSDQMEHDDLFKTAAGVKKIFNFTYYKMPPTDDTTKNQDFLEGMMVKPPSAILKKITPLLVDHVRSGCSDKTMWTEISKMNFDLLIIDEWSFIGRMIGGLYDIPTITYINWAPVSTDLELIPPFNLAFVPTFLEPYADTMTFTERVYNVMEYFRQKSVMTNMYYAMMEVCREYGFPEKTCNNIKDLHKNTALVFTNRNDAIHYPQPFMPHVISIDGFYIETPKPLNKFFINMIEKAGKHGIILVSFGSMFRRLSPQLSKVLAEAFAAMPQTVIWSYEGPMPESLGNNTYVNKWIPQQDLMNHPSIKLFVTQCGATSTFQAVNYALPTVGIPFFWDQPYNCQKLSKRVKSGQTVKLEGITAEKLQQAMEEVINDNTYKENAQIAADKLHNQPMDPKEKLLYWIDYIIRHKGAKHLQSQAANNLNFAQYFLLDIAFLLFVMIFVTLIICYLVVKQGLDSGKKSKVE